MVKNPYKTKYQLYEFRNINHKFGSWSHNKFSRKKITYLSIFICSIIFLQSLWLCSNVDNSTIRYPTVNQEPLIVSNLKNNSIQNHRFHNIENTSKDSSPENEIKQIDNNFMIPTKYQNENSPFKSDKESTDSTKYEDLSLSSSKNHSSSERSQEFSKSDTDNGDSDGDNGSFVNTILLKKTSEDNNTRPLVASRVEIKQSISFSDLDGTKTNTLPYSDIILNTSIKDHLHQISLEKRKILRDRLLKENGSQRLIQQFSGSDFTSKNSQISNKNSIFDSCDGNDDSVRDLPIFSERLPWENFSTKDAIALDKWKRLYSNSVHKIRASNLGGNALREKAREEIKQLKIERMNIFCI